MFSLMKHTRPLWAVLAAALLLAGCSDSNPIAPDDDELSLVGGTQREDSSADPSGADAPSTIAPGEPNPSAPLADVEALVQRLGELGVEAGYEGQSLEQSFLLPGAHILTIDGEEVRVYQYESVEQLKQDAAKISVDGGMLDGTPVRWIAPPRFYARSTLIALYVGTNDDIIGALEGLFGLPFAGQGAAQIVVDPLPPAGGELADGGVVDVPGIEQPMLLVIGTEEEVARWSPLVANKMSQDELAAVDLSANWIVAVFRGALPTAGYSIEIETVAMDEDGAVVVEVSLHDPGVDELVAQVITYPIDVKVVPRAELPDPTQAEWTARTADGRGLATFSSGGNSVPDSGPIPVEPDGGIGASGVDIRGSITDVRIPSEPTESGVLLHLLVEGPISDGTRYDRAWVEVVDSTALSFDGETFAPPTLADLVTGKTVDIRFTGLVRESYPVQAVASQVVIHL